MHTYNMFQSYLLIEFKFQVIYIYTILDDDDDDEEKYI